MYACWQVIYGWWILFSTFQTLYCVKCLINLWRGSFGMVSQVELLLVCAFKLYSVVWCTILKPKKPGNARKSVKTICTWKLDIKGTVKICVRNNWTVTEEKNLWPIVILKPLGKPLGSSGIPPLHPRVKEGWAQFILLSGLV